MDNEDIYINAFQTQNFPNLANLFDFIKFSSQKDLNVTACYYLYKIINALIRTDSNKILTYIYSRKDFLNFLLEKSSYQSINLIIKKILNIATEDDDVNMNFDYQFIKHRLIFYKKILKKITHLEEKNIEGLSDVFVSLFEEGEYIKDSEYFLEKFFYDKDIIYELLKKILKYPNIDLIKLANHILQKIFKKKDLDKLVEDKKTSVDAKDLLSEDSNDEDLLDKEEDPFLNNYKSTRKKEDFKFSSQINIKIANSLNRISLDKININSILKKEDKEEDTEFIPEVVGLELEEDIEKEINKDGDKITEITKEPRVLDLEVPTYDPVEMTNSEIIDKIESIIPELKLIIKTVPKVRRIQQDGKLTQRCGIAKIYLMKLIFNITKIDSSILKNNLLENDFLCDLLELFIKYPRNSVLHFEVYKVIESLCDYLFKTIDRAVSENVLESFLDFFYQECFCSFKNLLNKEKKKCYFIGSFDKLGIYLDKMLSEISCVYENRNFLKLKNEYLNSILSQKDSFLLENPKKSFGNDDLPDFNFCIKEDKMNNALQKNKNKKGISLNFEIDQDEDKKEINNQALLDDLIGNLQKDSNESIEEDSDEYDQLEDDEELLSDEDVQNSEEHDDEEDLIIDNEVVKLRNKTNFLSEKIILKSKLIDDAKEGYNLALESKSEKQIPNDNQFTDVEYWKAKKFEYIDVDKLLEEIN
jgi:hypothetical protein